MNFNEVFSEYLKLIGVSAKEFSDLSGISEAVLSRYRSGQRTPSPEGEGFKKILEGLRKAAEYKGVDLDIKAAEIRLTNLINDKETYPTGLADNLNTLIETFNIKAADIAQAINYEPAQLSRIRSKKRRPTKPRELADRVASYVVLHYSSPENIAELRSLVGGRGELKEAVTYWLLNYKAEGKDCVGDFLTSLDDFNLDEYIESIHFNDIKIPTAPFTIPTAKSYFGIEQMNNGELDFLKATVLSRSKKDVFMHNDLPMVKRAGDVEFGKKWMMGIAAMLKKGLHLNIIHELNRPFEEMMLGLMMWIPIYMTGQVSPYYLKNANSRVYHHLNYVSGSAALFGECVGSKEENGRYYLTKKGEELRYFRQKAEDILSYASPLMDIYQAEKADRLSEFLRQDASLNGNRRIINSSLPIYTISEELLGKIAERNSLSAEETKKLFAYKSEKLKNFELILQQNQITDEVNILTEEQFKDNPVRLSVAGMFINKRIDYTYAEYTEHLAQTKAFAETRRNYTLKQNAERAFKNIKIIIHEGSNVVISKDIAPTIHFVIHHPKLVSAIENFYIPIAE